MPTREQTKAMKAKQQTQFLNANRHHATEIKYPHGIPTSTPRSERKILWQSLIDYDEKVLIPRLKKTYKTMGVNYKQFQQDAEKFIRNALKPVTDFHGIELDFKIIDVSKEYAEQLEGTGMDMVSAYEDFSNQKQFDILEIEAAQKNYQKFKKWVYRNVYHEAFHKIQDKHSKSNLFLSEIEAGVDDFKSYTQVLEEQMADAYADMIMKYIKF